MTTANGMKRLTKPVTSRDAETLLWAHRSNGCRKALATESPFFEHMRWLAEKVAEASGVEATEKEIDRLLWKISFENQPERRSLPFFAQEFAMVNEMGVCPMNFGVRFAQTGSAEAKAGKENGTAVIFLDEQDIARPEFGALQVSKLFAAAAVELMSVAGATLLLALAYYQKSIAFCAMAIGQLAGCTYGALRLAKDVVLNWEEDAMERRLAGLAETVEGALRNGLRKLEEDRKKAAVSTGERPEYLEEFFLLPEPPDDAFPENERSSGNSGPRVTRTGGSLEIDHWEWPEEPD